MGNKIQLFGELESVAVDKKLVDAVQVKDSAWVDPEEMIRALAEKRDPVATEETQSKINERLREEALYAQSQLQNLSIHYDETAKRLHLLLEGEAIDGDGIDASDFTKDGMIETVLGPVTPVWDDVTDRIAASRPTEKVKWAVSEETGEQAFFALDVSMGYLLIQEITLGKTYLGFIWNTNTDADKTEGKVYDSKNFKASALDVSTLFNPIQAGPGLETVNDVTKIKIKSEEHEEKYLHVDKDGLFTTGIDNAIEDAVDDAKTELQSSINSLKGRVSTNEGAIQSHDTTLSGMNATITKVESDYKKADAALLGENNDRTSANTIYGVRNYATYVASRMAGDYLSKRVTSGNSVALYANSDSNVPTNDSGVAIDLASIFVTVGAPSQTEVEVEVQTATDGTVTLSWSGLTLSGGNPLIIRYRVIRTNTDA